MAPFGAGAGDGRERNVLEQPGVAAKTLQRLDRVDFGQARRSAPRGRTRRESASPPRRRAYCAARAPAISAAFFTAFIGAIGSPPRSTLPPLSVTRRAIASGQRGRIEPHRALARCRARRDRVRNRRGARTSASLFEPMTDVVAELARRRYRAPAGLACGTTREGEHHRRVRHIAAADVEQPADRLRVGDDERIGGEFLHLGAHARELVCARPRRRSAGRAARPRRAAAPAGRSRSRRSDCRRPATRLGAGRGAGFGEPLGAVDRMQPRRIAELGAGRQIGFDPRRRRLLDQMLDGESRRVELPRAPAPDSGRRRRSRRGRPARWRRRPSR